MRTGLIFDFDGLILDTETAGYQAWCEEYDRHGVAFERGVWLREIGTHRVDAHDPAASLRAAVGPAVDAEAVRARRDRRFLELVHAAVPRPGVVDLVASARDLDVPIAVASSSPRRWVEDHLTRVGLRDHFRVVVGRDDVGGVPKPSPRVYQHALKLLGLTRAVALEDSGPGLEAAVAAGLPTLVVPNEMTETSDFSAAARVVGSLTEVTVPDVVALWGERVAR